MNLSIAIVLLAHWIGDFVLQTRWMGDNKSRSLRALGAHVGTYGFVLLIVGGPRFALCNTGLHFIVDSITSRMTSRAYRDGQIHRFFYIIGFDQMIHTLCLLWTLQTIGLNPFL